MLPRAPLLPTLLPFATGFTETWLNGQLSDLLGTLVPVLASRGITSAAAAAGVSEQVWRETQGQAVDRLLDRVSALQGQNKAHERQLAACEAARQADNAACEAARQADSASVHQKLDAMLAHFSKQEAAHSKLEAVLAEHGAALAALPAHVKAVGAQETHKVIAFVCTAIVDLNAGVLAQVAGLVAPAPTAAAAAAAQDGAIPSPGSENLRTNGRGTDRWVGGLRRCSAGFRQGGPVSPCGLQQVPAGAGLAGAGPSDPCSPASHPSTPCPAAPPPRLPRRPPASRDSPLPPPSPPGEGWLGTPFCLQGPCGTGRAAPQSCAPPVHHCACPTPCILGLLCLPRLRAAPCPPPPTWQRRPLPACRRCS